MEKSEKTAAGRREFVKRAGRAVVAAPAAALLIDAASKGAKAQVRIAVAYEPVTF
ncbi:MAG: hypothetical protein JNK67_24120 [Alphaproteobacteria bacterium]|nr:hypothetical protein [Alphaproteobacteria bacterium]